MATAPDEVLVKFRELEEALDRAGHSSRLPPGGWALATLHEQAAKRAYIEHVKKENGG